MNKRKHLKHGTARKKSLLLVASMILLLAVAVVGTGAYLVAQDEPVTNVFEIAQVPNKVEEKFDLNIYGVRKAEGGARKSAYKNCFSMNEESAD